MSVNVREVVPRAVERWVRVWGLFSGRGVGVLV